MGGNLTIGILALQGAFLKHRRMLEKLGVRSKLVTRPHELEGCSGLILPGGESTTMSLHIAEMGLVQPLKTSARNIPFFGTCAGMILMARNGILNLLDITIQRNAYGRQCDSFIAELTIDLAEKSELRGIFIRAPGIEKIDAPSVRVLASYEEKPVCIEQGHHLACAFHPELTSSSALHEHFIGLCTQSRELSG